KPAEIAAPEDRTHALARGRGYFLKHPIINQLQDVLQIFQISRQAPRLHKKTNLFGNMTK
ncbi:MAG TPA: hypothetical protein VJK48_03200, partial [Chlamydiales bacterium]|nr:hypothetical protein [Chlamydiales bacterium]